MFEFEQLVDTEKLYEMLEGAETEETLPKFREVVSAVYFLFDKNDKIFYVGQAKNVRERYSEHKTGEGKSRMFYKEIAYFKFIRVGSASMRTFLEGAFIQLLRPRYNSEVKGRKNIKRIITDEQVIEIKLKLMAGEGIAELSDFYEVHQNTISRIRCGRSYFDVYVEGYKEWVELEYNNKTELTKEDIERMFINVPSYENS